MKVQFCNGDKLNVLHFQHNIYDLGRGYFEVLEQDVFIQNLKQYVKRLFELGHRETILNIMSKVGTCSIEHDKICLRVKALEIVTYFSSLLNAQKDKDFFQAVVTILTRWLSKEQEYHISCDIIFSQIRAVITKIFSLRLWRQSEPLITASRDIVSGRINTGLNFKRQVGKLHRDIADPHIINSLLVSFLESKESSQLVTGGLLRALAPHSSQSMIEELFKCGRREKRFELIEMIQAETDGVLPVLVEKLKDKQPWYVLRNSMILLGNLHDPDLYAIARPFLCHPDSRVQCETLNCITTLGGENVSQRLITSFPIVNDDAKKQLIDLLVPLHDPSIAKMFVDVLEKRISVSAAVKEKLILTMCSTGLFHLCERSKALLREIVKGCEYVNIGLDPALDKARELFKINDNIDNLS